MRYPKLSDYGYGTHLPLLLEFVLKTQGPVLEQGVGMFSTPLLHQLCEGNRILHSLETNPEWIKDFAHLRSDWHLIDDHEPDCDWYSVALIDGPLKERTPLIDKICRKTEFLILHDCDCEAYNYPTSYFPHRRVYTALTPQTMVVSHFTPVGGCKNCGSQKKKEN